MIRLNIDEKESLKAWQGYLLALIEESSVDTTEPIEVQKARIAQLEADPEAWFKYYFPSFATCEPAPFHKQATKRLLEHERWYEVRSWSRDLAKSTRSMMEVIYLALMGRIKNFLLVSNSKDKAVDLLTPFKLVLEQSPRITHDYGVQVKAGQWEEDKFVLTSGCSFRAIGAGQSPRGLKNKEARPDFILVDDIDTDERHATPTASRRSGSGSRKLSLRLSQSRATIAYYSVATSLPRTAVSLEQEPRRTSGISSTYVTSRAKARGVPRIAKPTSTECCR